MRIGAFCALIPYIYYGVGYCVVYFRLGLTTTFSRMNESQLHTFFVYTLNHLGLGWICVMLYYIWKDPEKGWMCKSHESNQYDFGREFRIDFIDTSQIHAIESDQLSKVRGYVNSKYGSPLYYDNDLYFYSPEDSDNYLLGDILEFPATVEDISNYQYVEIIAWA